MKLMHDKNNGLRERARCTKSIKYGSEAFYESREKGRGKKNETQKGELFDQAAEFGSVRFASKSLRWKNTRIYVCMGTFLRRSLASKF